MAQKRRVFQIAEKIRNLVALELLHAADPRFKLVTITSVMVSPDLRLAKIYWVVSEAEERRSSVEEALQGASGRLKRFLAKDLGVKFVPELKFYYDDTLDTYADVDRLFSRVHALESERQEDDRSQDHNPEQQELDSKQKI